MGRSNLTPQTLWKHVSSWCVSEEVIVQQRMLMRKGDE